LKLLKVYLPIGVVAPRRSQERYLPRSAAFQPGRISPKLEPNVRIGV
jgi:hypothetical protein